MSFSACDAQTQWTMYFLKTHSLKTYRKHIEIECGQRFTEL